MECRKEPDVPVTVMVYVPAGVPGVPLLPPPLLLVLPPPPQATSKTKPVNNTHASITASLFLVRSEPKLTPATTNPSNDNQSA
jgi:hypothetical protein